MRPSKVSLALTIVVASCVGASCGRNVGTVFDRPQQDPCEEMCGLQAGALWPMFQRCPSHAAYSPYPGPEQPTIAWTVDIGFVEGLAVAADGTIYFSSGVSSIVALSRDGISKWVYSLGDCREAYGWPAIGVDGTVYAATAGCVVALTPDGTLRWAFTDGNSMFHGGPVVTASGAVYVGDRNTALRALNPDGTSRWVSDWMEDIGGFPVVTSGGTAYLADNRSGPVQASWSGHIYSLTAEGARQVIFEQQFQQFGTIALDAHGTLYFRALDLRRNLNDPNAGILWAVGSDGTPLWTFEGIGNAGTPPAIGPDGTLYVGGGPDGEPHRVFALLSDGSLRWEFALEGPVLGELLVDGEGTVYVGGGAGELGIVYAIDADGNELWTLDVPGPFPARTLALGKGRLYVENYTQLIAVGE